VSKQLQLEDRKSEALQQQQQQQLGGLTTTWQGREAEAMAANVSAESEHAGAERCRGPAAVAAGSLTELQGDENVMRLAAMQLAMLAHQMHSSSSSSSRNSRQTSGWQQQQQQGSIPAYHLQLLAAAGLQDVGGMLLHQECDMSNLANCRNTQRHELLTRILKCFEPAACMPVPRSCSNTTASSSSSSSGGCGDEAAVQTMRQQLRAPLLLTCIEVAAVAQNDGEVVLAIVQFMHTCLQGWLMPWVPGWDGTSEVLRQPMLLLRTRAHSSATRSSAAAAAAECQGLRSSCTQQLRLSTAALH
jgi:hypothetical protein